MVSIMYNRVANEFNLSHLMTGLLEDSEVLNLNDHINIDQLPLDYDILNQIEYEYPASGNYFSYMTRGCPNKCSFCAVPILEPEFHITNNICEQIRDVNTRYGEKRNLLLLDNNIFNLSVEQLEEVVTDMISAGFTKEPTYIKENAYDLLIRKSQNPFLHSRIVNEAEEYLLSLEKRIGKTNKGIEYKVILEYLERSKNKKQFMITNEYLIRLYIDKYKSKRKLKRYVDFNQGLEAAREVFLVELDVLAVSVLVLYVAVIISLLELSDVETAFFCNSK